MKGEDFDAAGIEPAVQGVDDIALARGIDAGNDEQDGTGRLLEGDLQLHKLLPQPRNAGRIILA
jgi:hypothetical protein